MFSCHLPYFPASSQISLHHIFFLTHIVKTLSIFRWNHSFPVTYHIFLPIPKFFFTVYLSCPILSRDYSYFDETLHFLPLAIFSCQSPNFPVPFFFPAPYYQDTIHISTKTYFLCHLPFFPANHKILRYHIYFLPHVERDYPYFQRYPFIYFTKVYCLFT